MLQDPGFREEVFYPFPNQWVNNIDSKARKLTLDIGNISNVTITAVVKIVSKFLASRSSAKTINAAFAQPTPDAASK